MTVPATLLGVLQRQHARIGALIGEAFDLTGAKRAVAVGHLAQYLATHEAAEQIFVHPLGLGVTSEPAAIQDRLAEEQEIDVVFGQLEDMVPDSLDYMISLGLLEEAVLSHGLAEERVELPALLGSVGESELERAARAMAIVDVWDVDLLGTHAGGVVDLSPLTYAQQHRRAVDALAVVPR